MDYIYVAYISLDCEINEMMETDKISGLEEVSKIVANAANAIHMRTDATDIYFLYKVKGQFFPLSLCNLRHEDDCAEDIMFQIELIDKSAEYIIDSESLLIAFKTDSTCHWDYNFLKVSSMFGGSMDIFGPNDDYNDIVVQQYDNGEYDEGIISCEDDDHDMYIGDSALRPYSLSRDIFNIQLYLCGNEPEETDIMGVPMMDLLRGQRVKLQDVVGDVTKFDISPDIDSSGLSLDYSVFGINAVGKLAGDEYMCFCNQPSTPCGGVRFSQSGAVQAFTIDLNRLSPRIDRLVLTASIDGSGIMSQITYGNVNFKVNGCLTSRFSFAGTDFTLERVLILGEVYRKEGIWRFSATAQGFAGGLDALMKHYC